MKKVLSIVTNKFVLTALAFGVWMFFFDQNDFRSMQQRKQELQSTKDNIAYLNNEIARMEKDHEEMIGNPQRLEQYAREQYLMKRDNEDVYVIEK
ncbi:MAG TPA: septum formation initiator family protein [Flavipsychrobacter sp.]|jgi:cell division protein DivIC|nr:septum formation initiator family protein [Flavipsychrobacter sp.]